MKVFVGHDPRESLAFHVFVASMLEHASAPVSVTALTEKALGVSQRDGSNAFTYSRFLVPELCDYEDWAIFVDGDMIIERDIKELWDCRQDKYAAMVVKHNYKTQHPVKYIGSSLQCPNQNYPRKNWSSVILWNCAHPSNRVLTKEYVEAMHGSHLHRFEWLKDCEIGDLFPGWNHLVGEDAPGEAALRHHTLGVPGIAHYADWYASWKWHRALLGLMECAGENPLNVVKRAQERIGAVR